MLIMMLICRLLDSGITTFVSLIGEYSTAQYRSRYPAEVAQYLGSTTGKPGGACCVQFLHFPIRDFEVPDAHALSRLVDELKRRILEGETLFVHCRGGHGRTGTVVIPLLAALFNIPTAQAKEYVRWSTVTYRASDRYKSYFIATFNS
jgi:hypothetical protein